MAKGYVHAAEIIRLLLDFKKGFLGEIGHINERFKCIRSVYDQWDDKEDYQDSGLDGETDLYDPVVRRTVTDVTSGWMSYHRNPKDRFFAIGDIDIEQVIKGGIDTDKEKAFADRSSDIHRVIQQATNYYEESKVQRDKITFGIGGKRLFRNPDSESEIVTNFQQYPPEDVARVSSNGLVYNVFGVREKLSKFNIKERWPRPIMMPNYDKRLNIMDSPDTWVYSFSLPTSVWKNMVDARFSERDAIREAMGIVGLGVGNQKPGEWITVDFTENAILNSEKTTYQQIVISQFAPGPDAMSMGRGLGANAMVLALLLAEVQGIDLAAFERTFTPPWAVHEEADERGLNLGRDAVMYVSDHASKHPRPLSLGADMRAVMEFHDWIAARFQRIMFLDTFDLLNKSRMTKAETLIRNDAALRKLGSYIITDEAADLNPTVLIVNAQIHEKLKKNEQAKELSKTVLSAQFISPLSIAHRTNSFTFSDQIMDYLTQVDTILTNDGPINDVVDLLEDVKSVMVKSGNEHTLRTLVDASERLATREDARQSKLDQIDSQNIQAIGQAMSAGQVGAPAQAQEEQA